MNFRDALYNNAALNTKLKFSKLWKYTRNYRFSSPNTCLCLPFAEELKHNHKSVPKINPDQQVPTTTTSFVV